MLSSFLYFKFAQLIYIFSSVNLTAVRCGLVGDIFWFRQNRLSEKLGIWKAAHNNLYVDVVLSGCGVQSKYLPATAGGCKEGTSWCLVKGRKPPYLTCGQTKVTTNTVLVTNNKQPAMITAYHCLSQPSE